MNSLATAASHTASLRWSGHWIGGHQPRAATGTPADFMTGGDTAREFSRSMFRKTFDLQGLPAGAAARITADSRYVLWVNGQEVGRGPVRSQPFRQRYDSYDLAGLFRLVAHHLGLALLPRGLLVHHPGVAAVPLRSPALRHRVELLHLPSRTATARPFLDTLPLR